MLRTARTYEFWFWANESEQRSRLEDLAAGGSSWAMEVLGKNLFDSGLDLPTGEKWLRRAVTEKSPSAMFHLAVRLIETEAGRAEGIQLLESACDLGSLRAITELGVRLLLGEQVAEDHVRAEELLRRAATMGDKVAEAFGVRFISPGERSNGTREQEWVSVLGYVLYRESLESPTSAIRDRLRRECAALFYKGHQGGYAPSSSNLAYVIRRGEATSIEYPTLSELLRPGLASGDAFAQTNEALRLAGGVDCAVDWIASDRLVAAMRRIKGVIDWWRELFDRGDPEGMLVIGWLARHGLTTDPEGLSPAARLASVRKHWQIPAWMEA